MIQVRCARCGKDNEYADSLAGMRVACKGCYQFVTLPPRASSSAIDKPMPSCILPVARVNSEAPTVDAVPAEPSYAADAEPARPQETEAARHMRRWVWELAALGGLWPALVAVVGGFATRDVSRSITAALVFTVPACALVGASVAGLSLNRRGVRMSAGEQSLWCGLSWACATWLVLSSVWQIEHFGPLQGRPPHPLESILFELTAAVAFIALWAATCRYCRSMWSMWEWQYWIACYLCLAIWLIPIGVLIDYPHVRLADVVLFSFPASLILLVWELLRGVLAFGLARVVPLSWNDEPAAEAPVQAEAASALRVVCDDRWCLFDYLFLFGGFFVIAAQLALDSTLKRFRPWMAWYFAYWLVGRPTIRHFFYKAYRCECSFCSRAVLPTDAHCPHCGAAFTATISRHFGQTLASYVRDEARVQR